MLVFCAVFYSISILVEVQAAKILCLFAIPQPSHQIAFRPFTEELLKRSHDIDVVTADPMYPPGQTPLNMTEIDIHDVSYKIWSKKFIKGDKKDKLLMQMENALNLLTEVFKNQFASQEIQNLLKTNKFYDLIIADIHSSTLALIISHTMKAPSMFIRTTLGTYSGLYVGVPGHATFYSTLTRKRVHNLTFFEIIEVAFNEFSFVNMYYSFTKRIYEIFKNNFNSELPTLSELEQNLHMVLLNTHFVWDDAMSFHLNCVPFKFTRLKNPEVIPKEFQLYLDSSENGVLYASFGTTIEFSLLPERSVSAILSAFSELPYDILLKCNKDELPGRPKNVKLFKWLPQAEVLKHPKLKLFITHGGIHSIDEAIEAGVPMVVIPNAFDQFYNSERCVHHGVGVKVDLKTITKENLVNAIKTVAEDKSYRENVGKIHSLLQDTPMNGMDRLMWAIEYIIRHGGAKHMRPPSADLSALEYFEAELLCYLLLVIFVIILIVVRVVLAVKRSVIRLTRRQSGDLIKKFK